MQHLGLMWPSRDGCTFYDLPVRVNERYARHVTDRQTDRQISQKQNIFAGEMYSNIRRHNAEWAADADFDLGLTKSIHY